jgi:hypothetical protein
VFATDRWDSVGRFDLAMLDLRTAEVRPLVQQSMSDEQPS